jgi:ankyrin repeat protein
MRCVELGAALEERTSKLGWTPLITAVSEREPVATEALLMAGADIHARAGDTGHGCFSGASVWDFAQGDDDTLAVLKTYLNRQ